MEERRYVATGVSTAAGPSVSGLWRVLSFWLVFVACRPLLPLPGRSQGSVRAYMGYVDAPLCASASQYLHCGQQAAALRKKLVSKVVVFFPHTPEES